MKISVVTLFPSTIESYFSESIIKRAKTKGLIDLEVIDLRNYSQNKQRHVDDTPYSQTTGMLIQVDVVKRCLDDLKTDKTKVIITTPVAQTYKQTNAVELSKADNDYIILCGHYEGFDARVYDYCDYRFSIGDFVLTGGELAALAIADSIIRLIPGVIASDSLVDESFTNTVLEYDQYTRPFEFDGKQVPSVLANGNHKLIAKWKRISALENTLKYRPDLMNDSLIEEYEQLTKDSE